MHQQPYMPRVFTLRITPQCCTEVRSIDPSTTCSYECKPIITLQIAQRTIASSSPHVHLVWIRSWLGMYRRNQLSPKGNVYNNKYRLSRRQESCLVGTAPGSGCLSEVQHVLFTIDNEVVARGAELCTLVVVITMPCNSTPMLLGLRHQTGPVTDR